MPLTHISCEIKPEETVTTGACLACSESEVPLFGRRCQFTASILRAMYSNDESRKDAGISATGITGCTRATALKALTKYTGRPGRLWPGVRGTLFHLMPETHRSPHLIVEQRFKRAYDPEGHVVTGKPDEVDPFRSLLIDYKSVEKFPEQDDIRLGGYKEAWIWQLNIYRWILQEPTLVATGESYPPVAIETMGIVALGMGEVRKYPIPILEDVVVETFVLEHASEVQIALDGGPIPPVDYTKYNPFKSKLCTQWCGVHDACVALHAPQ